MAQQDTAINPFKGKASRVLRALMRDPKRVWHGVELAEELQLSQAWVNRVLKTLEKERIVQRGGAGRYARGTELLRPKELLRKWVQHYNFNQNLTYLYLIQKKDPIAHFKQVCKKTGGRYALTGYAAANMIRKIVHHAPPMAYYWPGSELFKNTRSIFKLLENQHGFIPVLKEANLILVTPLQFEIVFNSQSIKGINIVSPLQLFLDLYTMDADKYVIRQLADYWNKHQIPYEL